MRQGLPTPVAELKNLLIYRCRGIAHSAPFPFAESEVASLSLPEPELSLYYRCHPSVRADLDTSGRFLLDSAPVFVFNRRMATPYSLQQWIGEQAMPLCLLAFALLTGLLILHVSALYRRSALERDREGRTEDTFARELARYGFDTEIARTTYLYLREMQRVEFPIEPRDDLDRDLGLDVEELRETVRDLLQATGRTYLPGLLHTPLITVEDLVRYLQASPRRASRVA